MSTLSVHDLQGFSTYGNKVRVPNGHILDVQGRFILPSYPESARPSSAEDGEMILNTSRKTIEVWDGASWRIIGGGNAGADELNPANSAREAYENGNVDTTSIFVRIAGSGVYEMEYDPSDRFGTGDFGWIKYDAAFFGANNTTINHVEYGTPEGNMQPAWNTNSSTAITNDTIAQGTHRIGRDITHPGGLSLSTIRCALPRFTKAQYSASYVTGGADTADHAPFTQNFSGIVNNTAYEDNGQGYWAVLYSGNSAGSFATDMLIADPGNLASGNTSYSQNTGVLNFGTERGTSDSPPYIIWGTTDAYREYRYTTGWSLWLH